ncbi:MAG: hypothetical protein LBT36_01805 [Oscillospiraceae bacterium]|jgi:hypothetical protein|nr:hypothetical protein [Oscillospiraceae bacterium]
MDAGIIKVTRERYPALRFIGKRYTDADRAADDGSFSTQWEAWFAGGWFDALEMLPAPDGVESGRAALMGTNGEVFEYWIGVFCAENTPVPDGFAYADLPEQSAGVCWIHGKEPAIYWMHEHCAAELLSEDMTPLAPGARWSCFERYNGARFTERDEDGNAVLDYGIFIA